MSTRSKKLKPLVNVDELPSRPQQPTIVQMKEDLANTQAKDVVLVSLPSDWQDSVDFDMSTVSLTEDQRNNISDADITSLYDKATEVMTLRSQIESLLDESSKNVAVIAEKEKNLEELALRIK